jgi:predicted dehydrogenase
VIDEQYIIIQGTMKTVIIGCGLIGRKRALSLSGDDVIVACCDSNEAVAQKFGQDFNCKAYLEYELVFNGEDFDAVIVSVVNKFAQPIILAALKRGKHVLAEKPLGRNVDEAKEIIDVQNECIANFGENIILKTGFNHRFHPAVWEAKKMVDSNAIGTVFSIRARYGHGGRPGMEHEWRASKDLCGGGELLDQGVHVIDLIRWFGGEIVEVSGRVETKYWEMDVEDNAYVIAKTLTDVTAIFQVSWTNWKNIFSFEIFGSDGYLRIEGLGGSYGIESLEHGRRNKAGGKPDVETRTFDQEDVSWKNEWSEFTSAIHEQRSVIGSGHDGYRANVVIDALYRSNELQKTVLIE